jgi:acyl carrier protein
MDINTSIEKDEMVSKLTPIFRNIFGDNSLEITDDLSAANVENWDSLSHMLLITEIESQFAIKFKLKDLNKMKNVGDMMAIINSKL